MSRRSGVVYDPDRSRLWKKAATKFLRDQMKANQLAPMTGPLKLYYEAIFEPPKSYSKDKREQALAGELLYTKPPDLDNLLKIVLDAMNGIVFEDDKQVRKIQAEKKYGPANMIKVTIVERDPQGDNP